MKKLRRFETFDFYDAKGIEKHLMKMASKGWLLEQISGWWIYRKIEPRQCHFAVTYFADASDYHSSMTTKQAEFCQFCESDHWQLLTESAQMQIFVSYEEEPTPIETDERLRLDLIHEVMKKSVLPLNCCLFLLALFQFILLITRIKHQPLTQLSNPSTLFLLTLNALAMLYVFIDFIRYQRWYKHSLQAINKDQRIETHSMHRGLWLVLCILLAFMFKAWLALLSFIVACIALVVSTLFSQWVLRLSRKYGAEKVENLTVSLLSFILSFILLLNLSATTIDSFKKTSQEEVIVDNQTIYHDSLPLTVEALMPIETTLYAYHSKKQETCLLSYAQYSQQLPKAYSQLPQLTYEIIDVKVSKLYDLCMNELKKNYLNNGAYWQKIDPTPWQADTVLQLTHRGLPFQNQLIISWKERIVKVSFNFELSSQAQQKAIHLLKTK